jgi:hypothetical protein
MIWVSDAMRVFDKHNNAEKVLSIPSSSSLLSYW